MRPSSSGCSAGLSNSAKAPWSSCGAIAASLGAHLGHRPLDAFDAFVVPDIPRGAGREGRSDAAGAGHRAEDHHGGLRALAPDPDDRVEGARFGGCRRAEQTDLRRPADDQFSRPGGGRGGGEHPVPAQFQCRGERLGEQSVVVDHHEPHTHRALPPRTGRPPGPLQTRQVTRLFEAAGPLADRRIEIADFGCFESELMAHHGRILPVVISMLTYPDHLLGESCVSRRLCSSRRPRVPYWQGPRSPGRPPPRPTSRPRTSPRRGDTPR